MYIHTHKQVLSLYLVLILLSIPLPVLSKGSGYTGASGSSAGQTCGKNASCHSNNGTYTPVVTIYKKGTTIVPTTAVVDSNYEYTLVISGGGVADGFNLSADSGTLSSTQLDIRFDTASGELTHANPQAVTAGITQWDLVWRSPLTEGTATLFVCGLISNGNNNRSGDNYQCDNFPITVSASTADSTPPVFSVLADIELDSTAYLSPYTLPNVSATDDVDGVIGASAGFSGPFRTGTTVVTWSATDAAGNTAQADQNVNVKPSATIYSVDTLNINASYLLKFYLNGNAVSYPVDIPLTIGGTAIGSDYTISATTASFASGSVTELSLNILPGAVVGRTIDIRLDAPASAADPYILGGNSNQLITITDSNMGPSLSLTAAQGINSGSLVDLSSGTVTVTASTLDLEGNALAFDWTVSDTVIQLAPSYVIAGNQLNFDPADLGVGVFTVAVSVSDDGVPLATSLGTLNIMVVDGFATLTNADTDGDGLTDDVEGELDKDHDGVKDYLDLGTETNVLAIAPLTDTKQLVQATAGTQLRIGRLAYEAQTNGVLVYSSDVVAAGISPNPLPSDMVGAYDMEILLTPEQSLSVVLSLPVLDILPAVDSIKVYSETNSWQPFAVDSNNYFNYADIQSGICPMPGPVYNTTGQDVKQCLQIVVNDGGPNDADGTANGIIKLRMGSSGSLVPALAITPDSGGGAAMFPVMFLLFWISCILFLNSRKRI